MADEPTKIGFLHPGTMGSALARLAKQNDALAFWASSGRSPETRQRAGETSLLDAETLEGLTEQCELLISICPPHGALEVAKRVAKLGYSGIYVDANAIAPHTALQIAEIVTNAGGSFVDAAIVGPPPTHNEGTVMFLSGEKASSVATFFGASNLSTKVLGTSHSEASALKICHSAMGKGMLALMLATAAAADHHGVRHQLESLWSSRAQTKFLLKDLEESPRRAAKGWRFTGEMREAAETLREAGLPSEFHLAASEIFSRCPPSTGSTEITSIDELIKRLLDG